MILWLRFLAIQIASAILMSMGWWVLALMSALRLWKYRAHDDHYSWRILDGIYGNSEDGLAPYWYQPTWPLALRVYVWSAWRNSTNNWNRKCAVRGGPFVRLYAHGWYAQAGFRPDNGWPVLSAGRHGPKFDY